ncbi:MAG TPA: hypothetical protein VE133_06860 [Candidatus Sulfotelmatobacter sp.]|jgi:hypothetical protein|nr:hypothetical protein [Candidatus Sulfotelmatobacter sp.]
MKLFVHFDEQGRIISVAKVHVSGGAAQNPFLHLEQQDRVLEMNAPEELRAMDAHEIAEQYMVDLKDRTLRKLKQAGEAPPEKKRAVKKVRRKSDRK